MAKSILQPLLFLSISVVTFLVCYLLAITVQVGTISYNNVSIILVVMGLSFLIHWIMFIPSYVFQTEKFYDLTGSLTYITILIFVVYIKQLLVHSILDLRSILILSCIIIWTVRLGSFLFWRVLKDGEDKRFRTILPSFSQLFMTWTLSAAWVFIQLIAALVALTSLEAAKVPFGIVGYIGLGLWIFGFIFQVVADYQKTRFKSNPKNEGNFINEGLWRISRHPNYFGEIVLWTGIAIMAVPVMSGLQYVSLVSPVFGFLLIYFVSGVRLLENKADKKWGNDFNYQEYKEKTPVFFPNFFK